MNYQETLKYLYAQLPMYHRIGAAAYKANLDNTIALCNLLGNPQNKIRTVHIAGTNGKGSVAHFIASVLQEHGYKTGLFTSPHLKDYRERIKINGEMIPKERVLDFIEQHKTSFDHIKPSFFEWTFALAMDHFADEKVDIAVIETGLGGRLDSTNVIIPELSVITNIGLDHTNLLGDSLEKIAGEKAGIIKQEIPVVLGKIQEEIKSIFKQKAERLNAPIYYSEEHYSVLHAEVVYNHHPRLMLNIQCINGSNLKHLLENDHVIQSPLTGYYQVKNIPVVLMALDILKSKGYDLTEKKVKTGIANVIKNTEFLGRWQKLGDNPLVICDTGHNADGIKEILQQISFTPHNKLHMVLGFVNDKDIGSILSMLPLDAIYYFCKASVPRALNENVLDTTAAKFNLHGNAFATVTDAYLSAKKNADTEDLIFIGGSTFVVADVL